MTRRPGTPARPLGSAVVLAGVLAVVLTGVLVVPPAAVAQSVVLAYEVTVRVSAASGEVVSTAYVRVVDGDERILAQGATDASGRVTLRLQQEGTFRLEVDRLGYDDWASEPRRFEPGMPDPIEVTLQARAFVLDGFMALGDGRCGTPPEEGPAIVRMIELSRELLGRVIATERRVPEFHARVILEEPERPRARFQVYDTLYLDIHRTRRSPPPEELVTEGFLTPRHTVPGTPGFHAVTPEVAMSDPFIETRCFRIAEHRDSTWTGLAFRPLPDSRVFDTWGTIWLDTLAGRPARIEYHWSRLQDFLWDHELRAMRAMRADPEWGESQATRAMRAAWAARDARRQWGTWDRVEGIRTTWIQRARERDFGGMIEFMPFLDGWVTSRATVRWPALSGGFLALLPPHVGARVLFQDAHQTHRLLALSQTVEWISLVVPNVRARPPRAPWSPLLPLPPAARELDPNRPLR